MFAKSRLTAIALISFAATTAMATTNANAFHDRVSTCDVFFLAGCGAILPTVTSENRRIVRLPPPPRDTSPTYMKQTDPRYSSAMNNAGGGGGGSGGGSGGGGGGGGGGGR